MATIENAENKRNHTLDCFRYFAAILVVALHVTAFADIHPMLSYLFAQVLPRIAVPFFLTTAGYFHARRVESGTDDIGAYLSRIIVTYAVWSVIYFILRCILNESIPIQRYIVSFLFTGSEYHFWYFPALVLAISLTSATYRIGHERLLVPLSILLYALGCLGNSHYWFGMRIKGVSRLINSPMWDWISCMFCMGIPFFVCGHMIAKLEKRFKHIQTKVKCTLFILCLLLFLAEVLLVKTFAWSRTISVTPCLYMLVVFMMLYILDDPIPLDSKLAQTCRALANYTYYSHVALIMVFSKLARILGVEHISETVLFVLIIGVTAATGLMLGRCRSKAVRYIMG